MTTSPRNILVIHAAVGAGHARAADAVAAALALESPDTKVTRVDALQLARPLFKTLYNDGYMGLVEKAPAIMGHLFRLTDRPPSRREFGDRFRRAVQRWSLGGLVSMLEGGRWDAVVNTHFLAPELIAALRREGRFSAPQMTVVTDYDAHRIWVHEPTQRYCVASPRAAASLRRHGVEEEAVAVTGIPIDPAFSSPIDREEARRSFAISDEAPVLVLAAGGRGMRSLEANFRALIDSRAPSSILVACGRNESARRALSRVRVPTRHRVQVLGYTERMRVLMAAADVLVTKPGGLTVSEALACGLPMVLVDPIPGQEERNADYLVENRAALVAASARALTGKAEGLLSDRALLEDMRRRAKKLGHPRAAFVVARQALELARGRADAATSETRLAAATTDVLTSH